MNAQLLAEVTAWIADDPDPKTAAELTALISAGDEATLKNHFAGFLQFGTAGLRGPIGPGPSCMNRAVVGRTASGLAAYMKERGMNKVVIGRDARHCYLWHDIGKGAIRRRAILAISHALARRILRF